jgi:single-strand DNA-binding protein
MNFICLIGRLTRDPEYRMTPNGKSVTNFDIAVDRPTTNAQGERETDFIRIVTWGKQAEACANNLKKGRLLGIEGRLQIRAYETQDGQKRRVAEVVANFVQFLDRGENSPPQPSAPAGDDLGGISLDDLPF